MSGEQQQQQEEEDGTELNNAKEKTGTEMTMTDSSASVLLVTPEKESDTMEQNVITPMTEPYSGSDAEEADPGATSPNDHEEKEEKDQDSKQQQQQQQQQQRSLADKWAAAIHSIRYFVTRGMQFITYYAATWPRITLGVCTCLSIGLLVGGFLVGFTLETENYDLWPPEQSLSREHFNWILYESHFNYDPVLIDLYIHQKGDNVLSQNGVERVFEAIETVSEMEGYKDGCDLAELIGDVYSVGQCHIVSVADFWNESRAVFEESVDSDQDAIRYMSREVYPDGIQVDRKLIFGNIQGRVLLGERNDTATVEMKQAQSLQDGQGDGSNFQLVSAQSYIIQFGIPWSNMTLDFEAKALENLLDLQQKWDKDPNNPFHLEIQSHSSYSDEFIRAIMIDLWLMPLAFFLMCGFTVLVFAKFTDRVKSRGLLGIGTVLCIVGALMASFGIMFLVRVPFTTQTIMLPFLMFGIGLDDGFIIFGSYSRKDPNMDVVERVQATIEDIGMSIFLTTITSALAFGLGALSNIPAVSWLCLYACPAILMDLLYQITFFISILVLDERRIQENRMDWCTCIKVERKELTTASVEATTEVDEQHLETSSLGQEQQQPPEEAPAATASNNHNDSHDNSNMVARGPEEESDDDNSEARYVKTHPADRFMSWYASKLLNPKVQAVVFVLFCFVLGGSIYNTTQLRQQFDFTDLVPDDSYLKHFYNAKEKYSNVGLYTDAIFRNVDQSDPAIQDQMEKYITDLTNNGPADEPTYFWLRAFKAFMAEPSNSGLAELPFDEQIDAFLDVPINYELYDEQLGRSFDGRTIYESRVQLHAPADLTDSKDATEVLGELRAVSRAQEINQGVEDWRFFTYDNSYHIYEFYNTVVKELTFTTILGVAAVNIVALLFIPHWTALPFILPFITFLYIEMLGFLYISGVQINAISYVTLVMSIGLMVDYIMHILLRYYESHGTTRGERVKDTLSTLGSSMLLGAISTFLGIMALSLSTSAILRSVFLSIIGLISLGVLNGLVFLPVTLAVIGPE